MPDNDIRIRINLEGQSIASLKHAQKEMKFLAEHATIGSAEFKKLSASTAELRNRINEAGEGMKSSAHKMKDAYFVMGTQLRASAMAGTNFSRILQDMPYGLQGVANNIEPLVFSLQQLKTQAAAAGMSMKTALLGVLTGPGGLMIAVGAVSFAMQALPKIFKDSKKEADSLATSIMELKNRLGFLTDEVYRSFLLGQQMRAQEALQAERNKKIPAYASAFGPLAALFKGTDPKEVERLEQQYLRAFEARQQFDEKQDKAYASQLAGMAETRRGGPVTGLTGAGLGLGMGTIRATRARPVEGVGAVGAAQFAQLNAMSQDMINSMKYGVSTIANQIRSDVGRAWENVFGQANSLFEQFAQNVASTFAGMLAQRAASWLLSFIPGFGPAFSVASGASSVANVAGRATGGDMAGEVRALRADLRSGIWRVENTELAFAVAQGNTHRNQRLFQ